MNQNMKIREEIIDRLKQVDRYFYQKESKHLY